jgi:diacylglycerol O-acyltransferase / wax synthase
VLPQLRTLLSGDLSPLLSRLPPQTRFSGDVSAHRVFEAVGLPLGDFKPIRAAVGGSTLNDLFLAIVGGALNKYLDDKGELPDTSMVAMVPMTLRGADKGGDRGNQVGFTMMPVYSEIADPLERLRAISESARTSKRVTDAVGKELVARPARVPAGAGERALLRNVRLPGVGLIVSNVRGPDVPLYMAGARLVNYAPISIAIDGMGLNCHRVQLPRHHVDLRRVLSRHAARPGLLRGLPARELRRAQGRPRSASSRASPRGRGGCPPRTARACPQGTAPPRRRKSASGSKARRSRKAAAPAARTGRRKRKAAAKATPAQE